jgi:diguanylate cyclase (GGDEF)-like protein
MSSGGRSAIVISWEQKTSRLLDGIGLRSIKSKITIFALLATLIPSVTMGWLSYHNNRRAIDETILRELANLTSHAAREFGLWLRDRRYEAKVFSSSYEVSENIVELNRPGVSEQERMMAQRRIEDYLRSVGDKFVDYAELVVIDARGELLASSSDQPGALVLEDDWLERVKVNQAVIGDAYRDEAFGVGVMTIVEPIVLADGSFLGSIGVKVRFDAIESILNKTVIEPSHDLYLMTRRGEILSSTGGLDGPFMSVKLDTGIAVQLFAREKATLAFQNHLGTEVVGTLHTVPDLEWGVVAVKDRSIAYAEIARLRNVTMALICAVLLIIGLAAYLLGMTIVRPLDRLTQGATKVAGGDLDIILPSHGRSEVGYMTEVFNDMVGRLRLFRDENTAINQKLRDRNDELRELSITDSLTGLYNRTHLPELLERELARARRRQLPFSILMMDIDHFKRFNDTYGHLAGDEQLRLVAQILRNLLRACDAGARYGGEEFLILLTETGPEGALFFAEKLRARVEEVRSQREQAVTVSIGVASFPDDGDDIEGVIREADAALYRCKRGGRNQVALARADRKAKKASLSLR